MTSRFNSLASHAAYDIGAQALLRGYEAALNDLYITVHDDIDFNEETINRIHAIIVHLRDQIEEHLESFKQKED